MDYYSGEYHSNLMSYLVGFGGLGIFIVTTLLSLAAMGYLHRVYARNSQVLLQSGITGAEAAARILQWAGINDVSIQEGDSFLGDHYDPMNKRLVLSPDNYRGTSAAHVGVAAHECGHAVQHQQGYEFLKLRMASVYATNFANQIIMWGMIFLGFLTQLLTPYVAFSVIAIAWGVVMFFNLITLPVEFDASARAKKILAHLGMIQPGREAEAVNATLNAAGLTYVAAFITSLAYMLYYLFLMFLSNRGRD